MFNCGRNGNKPNSVVSSMIDNFKMAILIIVIVTNQQRHTYLNALFPSVTTFGMPCLKKINNFS